ncbi:hypothetical protein AB0L05_14305 [Nonomuraea pusilla]|uniref:hypothetical protein n=1 Tax=Nonomuraea pusilla TaxID=46177 RepID=UPI0034342909
MSCPLIANATVARIAQVDGCGRPVCGDKAFTFGCFASQPWRPTSPIASSSTRM